MMFYALIPLLPFASFLVIGLFGHLMRGRGHYVGVPAVFASLLLSLSVFWEVVHGFRMNEDLYVWILSGDFRVAIGFHIDQLTAVMLILVTGVSSLVHLYSIGYMHGDRGYNRFFAYLGLFTFSMLMLVMANNFLQLYFFWEAVGLCSYLLIAHWYERKSACDAATKAFIVNRVGDFGFGLGVLLKMGGYGFLRFCLPMMPNASIAWMPIVVGVSVVAIIYGAYMALAQEDLKKLIAYSSVSHMGFVTLGILPSTCRGLKARYSR